MLSNNDILPESLCTTVTKAVIDCSKSNNVKCAVVSIGKPYDTANYTDADALLVAYGCKGMNAEDTNGALPATYTYGPNIIASVEVAFGYKNPYGTLPVDVPRIRDDGTMDISQNTFSKGDGLLYAGTEKPSESSSLGSEVITEKSTMIVKSGGSFTDNLILNLHENGTLNIVLVLSVCALIVFIILIVVIIKSLKPAKRKNKVSKKTKAIVEELEAKNEQ